MAAVVVRLAILAAGIGFGQMFLDSVARGAPIATVQLVLTLVFLAAGTAGFIVPLLEGGSRRRESRHV